MRTSLLPFIVLAALGAGGFAGALVTARGHSPVLPSSDEKLVRALGEIESKLGGLQGRVAALETRPASVERTASNAPRGAPPDATVPDGNAKPQPPDPEAAARAERAAAIAELTPQFERLVREGITPTSLKALFDEVSRAGRQDAAVESLEALLEKDPKNAKLHYLMARACYARVMLERSPAGFEKWGDRILGAWQQAAELDPDWWEPRFERAEYLTYYPESEGKTPEVITELESLVELQERTTREPRHARTYAHLSRMYLRLQRRDKALQTLRDGLARFPDDAELKKQLEVLER